MKKKDLIELIEEEKIELLKEESIDINTYSAVVFYSSSFGSGGSSSFGSAIGISTSSSFGSSRNTSFYGSGIGSPSGINPSGPLASPFEIKKPVFAEPIKIDLNIGCPTNNKIDYSKMMEQNKALQGVLSNMPNIPSKFGAPVSMPETQALTNIVNQGMPAISSKFGCAGNQSESILEGGLKIDLGKSTKNTSILKEDIYPIRNTYIHHNRGLGRMEINIFGKIGKEE